MVSHRPKSILQVRKSLVLARNMTIGDSRVERVSSVPDVAIADRWTYLPVAD